ncbi:hypothetical protein [Geochorda subterranea]|uniref:Uncharacterized protein n=1 Tax=Geochorda subterranea TaxID=3109564 RepID=A0ABZ1BRQ3_9FIRM|nr:hypothetical protein [Limnochorda sp. LNt]WRP14857.1 hypothetical protein VLY81_01410 [Limnochorda sp. LNt]
MRSVHSTTAPIARAAPTTPARWATRITAARALGEATAAGET